MEDLHMCCGWDDDHNCTSFLTCQEIYGARTFYIDTNFSTSSVTFGGGSGTHQGDGIYAFDYTIQKEVNNIQIVADASVPYRRNASGCNGCKFDDSTADGTSSLSMVVYGVEVVPLAQSIEVAINDLSQSTCDVPIKYDIQPHEYKAGNAYVFIYRGGDLINIIPSDTQGAGFATLARGFQFEDGVSYNAQVVLNPGSGTEIKSPTIELKPGAVQIDRIELVDPQVQGYVVPLGDDREVQAFISPAADHTVVWSIRHQEIRDGKKVIAHIKQTDKTHAVITAEENSASGWIIVRAADEQNPCVYKETRVFVGCQICENGDCDKLPGNVFLQLHSIDVGIGLGRGRGGQPAGHLFIQSREPDATLYTPEGLMLSSTTGELEARYGSDQLLRQVMAPEALVDIRVHASTVYSLDFYRPEAVTEIVKDAYGNIVSKIRTTYREFEWGEEVEITVTDPDGAALTTTTEYYDDPEQAGSYGRIVRQVNPDGSWIRYEYDAQGRMVAYDYQPVDPDDSNDARDTERPRTV